MADAGDVAAEDGTEFDVHAATKAIRKGHVDIDVSSAQHEGRVLFFTIDGETLDPSQLANPPAALTAPKYPRQADAAAVNAPPGARAADGPEGGHASVTQNRRRDRDRRTGRLAPQVTRRRQLR